MEESDWADDFRGWDFMSVLAGGEKGRRGMIGRLCEYGSVWFGLCGWLVTKYCTVLSLLCFGLG